MQSATRRCRTSSKPSNKITATEKKQAARSSLPAVTTDEEMTDTDSDAATFVDFSTDGTAVAV